MAQRIGRFGTTDGALLVDYLALVRLVSPAHLPRIIEQDADGDHLLAYALAAQADLIVSGDKHLHRLGGHYHAIAILTPAQAVERIEAD